VDGFPGRGDRTIALPRWEFLQAPALAGVTGELGGNVARGSMSPRTLHLLFLRASALVPTRAVDRRLPRVVGAATWEMYPCLRNFSQVSMCLPPLFPERALREASAAVGRSRAVAEADASPLL
jgi:hypothetical protein